LAATATVIVATGQSPANIIILSLTVVSVSFVGLGAYRTLSPLVSPDVDAPVTVGGRTRVALEREKALVLRSIKELEFDFAMRKMSQADFDEMAGRLRQRALGLMEQLDASGSYRDKIAEEVVRRLGGAEGDGVGSEGDGFSRRQDTDSPFCTQCGKANDPDAKFCKACGSKL
ncbi:MAG: zinc ribbon domain-containing protein, partial [Acidobacteriota bacterium]|nr:zinc ribbon domain-containing protein [Acidobacteriota bacterium]